MHLPIVLGACDWSERTTNSIHVPKTADHSPDEVLRLRGRRRSRYVQYQNALPTRRTT
jgi:hypothetical protein